MGILSFLGCAIAIKLRSLRSLLVIVMSAALKAREKLDAYIRKKAQLFAMLSCSGTQD